MLCPLGERLHVKSTTVDPIGQGGGGVSTLLRKGFQLNQAETTLHSILKDRIR